VIRARWIWTGSALLPDAAVAAEAGRVTWVGPAGQAPTGDETTDLPDALLLPGLINAHTHLELSDARPGPTPASFGEWLLGIVRTRQQQGVSAEDAAGRAAERGVEASLSSGVTHVGDISRFPGPVRRRLRDGRLRATSFGEIQSMAGRREMLDDRFEAAGDLAHDGPRLRVGITPHAPYTVEPDAYRRCVSWSRQTGRPICTHLAESPEEARFLRHHEGPLREMWEALGAWTSDVPRFDGSPVAFAASVGLLDLPALLAHVNYVDDDDLDRLSGSPASVVFCPRTHAYFGHEPHPFETMLARGVNVCVGTDSRASSPDLNVVDDLRLLRRQRPHLPADLLWSFVTTRAAKALRLLDQGHLGVSSAANVVAFEAADPDPLAAVLDAETLPLGTWVEGERVA
jgi:cytosine/adenosine deaminase-related metal-dependent hydrolase